jgi:hypothetical protein
MKKYIHFQLNIKFSYFQNTEYLQQKKLFLNLHANIKIKTEINLM